MQDNIVALVSAEPCSQCSHRRSKADWSLATATGHGSQRATGLTVTSAFLPEGAAAKRVEKEDEEEERRRAELRRAHDQLQKCLEEADYMGAAAVSPRSRVPSHARKPTMDALKQIGLRCRPQAKDRRRPHVPL